ncbi:hypothetical protein WH47_09020, partial [Habropoda laboriosa]
WEVLSHSAYFPYAIPSNYHLFRLMQHNVTGQHLRNLDEVRNWVDNYEGYSTSKGTKSSSLEDIQIKSTILSES